ncbi:MAG: PAS domain S-box protein, partial [Verrucomicrobiota bacterium]
MPSLPGDMELIERLTELEKALRGEADGVWREDDALWVRAAREKLLEKTAQCQTLRESEERHRKNAQWLAKVFDSSLDVICAVDEEGRFLQVSAACEGIWGYRREELIGTLYLDKVLPEDQEKTREIATRLNTGTPI